jgi:ribosome-binding factor A
MTSTVRQKRVADRLQAVISELIQREMNDPRLELVTVTRVIIDRELEYANVFVCTVGDESRQSQVLNVLKGAHGFIRREVGRRVQLRRTPEIIFHWDLAPDKGEHVEQLLDQLRAGQAQAAGPLAAAEPPDPDETPANAGSDEDEQ